MEIKGKVHCLFEQSATFRDEFRKLGYESFDYDIQNSFGKTDYQIDLFVEIEKAYDEEESIFNNITKDDLIIAFFPCIYFEAMQANYYQMACNESFISGAEWQSKQSPWISVEDAIPNELAKGMCQVKYVDGSIDEMAMREVNKWIYPYIKTGYVTHWKPIPSFDEILEANKDVLERIKEKGD